MPPLRELQEQATAGDPSALFALRVLARLEALPARVRSALERERIDVVLADGSSMPLDDTERVLAMKEERRAHRALRTSLDEALAPFLHFTFHQIDDLAAPRRSDLQAFLAATRPLRDAAREALAVLGGEPLEDAASLARALDLPDDEGLYGEEQTRALVTAARDAARPPLPVTRFRAPRALAGLALDAPQPQSAAGFAWPPGLRRFDRHARTVEAGCTALAWAHGSEAGRALALGLGSAPCRRAIGTDRHDAERVGRIGAAVAVLRARGAVALASVVDAQEARDALADALGVDPGATLLSELATAPWVSLEDLGDAAAWMAAPARLLQLREAFDETWPLRTEAWHELAALEEATPAEPPAAEAAKAWFAWASESL